MKDWMVWATPAAIEEQRKADAARNPAPTPEVYGPPAPTDIRKDAQ